MDDYYYIFFPYLHTHTHIYVYCYYYYKHINRYCAVREAVIIIILYIYIDIDLSIYNFQKWSNYYIIIGIYDNHCLQLGPCNITITRLIYIMFVMCVDHKNFSILIPWYKHFNDWKTTCPNFELGASKCLKKLSNKYRMYSRKRDSQREARIVSTGHPLSNVKNLEKYLVEAKIRGRFWMEK